MRNQDSLITNRAKTIRNNDYVEVTVREDDRIVLKGAFIYGFRNIQNLVMKMKVVNAFKNDG